MRRFIFFRWWFVLGLALIAAILLGSLWPKPMTLNVPNEDKVVHLLAYAVLMGWFILLYPRRAYHHGFAVLFIAFGILIEGLQALTGTRFAEWSDVVANSSGVAIAWALGATRLKWVLLRVDHGLARRCRTFGKK
jgi:VanZ family protein